MSVSKKLLPPPFMGEVAERNEVGGGSHFSQKSGNFRIFAVQIFWLPPAFGHPPHKCGGQDRRFFDKLKHASATAEACFVGGDQPMQASRMHSMTRLDWAKFLNL